MTCFCLDTHLCFITQGKNPSDLLKTRMLKITRQICQGSRWWGTWRPTTWHDLLPSLLNTKSYGKTRQEQAPHACQITSTSQLNATLHHAPLDFFSEWRASSPILFPFPSLCQQSHTAMYNTSVGGCQTVQTNRLVVVVVLLPWFTWSKCLTKVEQISLAGGCEHCAKTPMSIQPLFTWLMLTEPLAYHDNCWITVCFWEDPMAMIHSCKHHIYNDHHTLAANPKVIPLTWPNLCSLMWCSVIRWATQCFGPFEHHTWLQLPHLSNVCQINQQQQHHK